MRAEHLPDPSLKTAYAGFGFRLAALWRDVLIAGAPVPVLLYFAEALTEIVFLVLAYATIFLFPWLYFALMESGPRQATFGKRGQGIIVTDLNGRRISFRRATGRFWGKVLL